MRLQQRSDLALAAIDATLQPRRKVDPKPEGLPRAPAAASREVATRKGSAHSTRWACKHGRVVMRMTETPHGELPFVRCAEGCGHTWKEVR